MTDYSVTGRLSSYCRHIGTGRYYDLHIYEAVVLERLCMGHYDGLLGQSIGRPYILYGRPCI